MKRRLVVLSVVLLSGLSMIATAAHAATTRSMFLTFYGWYDNTPPGGDIAYPQIHSTAGGSGTFSDPITFATATAELSAGTKVYVPRVKKYFIMEDSCQECGEDWSGHGPNGGPGLYHIDLWLGGKGGSAFDAIDCEDALTHYNADSTPTLEDVIVSPASGLPYDSTPLFNTSTGACYGGAQPTTTVGQYKNVSTGQCLDDPNNASSTGTVLHTAACSGGASQRFTFHGAFLVINGLCAGMSGSNIVLQTCTGGPAQQWSINPNLTISDIQTGQKCFRNSGSTLTAGSCSGAAAQWNFSPSQSGPSPDYQAEDATLSAATVATNHTGFTGTGFVDYVNAPGGYIEWTVNAAAAGTYRLTVRYANGTTADRPLDFAVNGTTTSAGVSFPQTTNWDTWATKSLTVTLNAGANTIRATGTGSVGGPNVDVLTVTPEQTGPAPVDYQAEDGALSAATVASNHTGFTGTGFVDYVNAPGGYIEWTVSAPTAGTYTLTIRYANGTTTTRPLDFAVNGTTTSAGVSFPQTTNWDTWATKSLTVTLNAGANTIRATGTGSTGGPNVDKITVGL
ncbi:carbohydrate-binding protein [Streptosporangiaceae bacterium NEAU-GS5]|nr:carbohydrate-binding protein [Streptosporangiaceae bacterium NEAU-GS5]